MLLQELPEKTVHRIVRSVTWAEVGSFYRVPGMFRANNPAAVLRTWRFATALCRTCGDSWSHPNYPKQRTLLRCNTN